MKKMLLNKGVSLYFQTPENKSYKFGYYNYSPINKDGNKLLAHRIYFEGRMPKPDDCVDIGYFSIPDGKWFKLTESNAFNWQQGSMLQWLGPDFNGEIIFNDAIDNSYISRIININTGKERKLPKAIYGIDPNGEFSISLNFERCNFTRAYSYASVEDQTWNKPIPEKDGIIRVDLRTGNSRRIIPLKSIVEFAKSSDFDNQSHWFEHIMLNPLGNRFAFYHRYSSETGFITRCFTADSDGNTIWLHPNKISEWLSHLGWMDDKKYVIYTYPQSKIRNLLVGFPGNRKKVRWYMKFYRYNVKPFLPRSLINKTGSTSSYYALVKDQSEIIDLLNPEPRGMDGHPSFTKNSRFMLTDTYADKEGFRYLMLYDLLKKETLELGKFYSFFNNCGWRADLHPRFSPDENYVIIDSTHKGHHQMLVLELDWDQMT
jgi:hypothetical protein